MRETVVTSVVAVILLGIGAMIVPAPIWLPLAIIASGLVFLLIIALIYLPEIRLWLKRGAPVEYGSTAQTLPQVTAGPVATDWHEFNSLPLKYVACMWVGLPVTDESLKSPKAQEELTRLSLAVRQGKLEHPNPALYTLAWLFSTKDIEFGDTLFSKAALVRYAEETNRPIPDFLKPTLEKLKASPPAPNKPEASKGEAT